MRNPSTGMLVWVPQRAKGGIVTQPELALIGEAGPELIIPVNKLEEAILSSVPHLAEGGIVTKPTIALIGEAGPEAVTPIAEASTAPSQTNTIYLHISIGNISTEVELEDVKDKIVQAVAEGIWRRN